MDISTMLEVQVKEETDVKENVTPGVDQPSSATGTTSSPISVEEMNYYKLMFRNDFSAVRLRRIHCTACDMHIGSAPSQIHKIFEHPVLRTLLCGICREFYGDGIFEQGDDATDMFCRWCANGGNLYCCSYCNNTFCYKCIKRNFTLLMRKNIEADEKWKCFVCNPRDLYSARAMCWAVFQHLQAEMRRIMCDKELTAQEIEEKMNTDDSLCCPHRSKRKRRKPEDSRISRPRVEMPSWVKPKPKPKLKYKYKRYHRQPTNGIREIESRIQSYISSIPIRSPISTKPPIPIRPRPAPGSVPDDQSKAESSVNHEESAVNESIVVSSPSMAIKPNTLPPRFDSNTSQQRPTLYHASFMNTSGSTAYIQSPVTVNSATRIILPPQPQSQPQLTSYQSQQPSLYQSQQTNPLQHSYPLQQASLYHPRQANSYQPQQPSSYQSQQANSYQSQQASSYQPQQTSSYQPQQASSSQSQQANSLQSLQTSNTMVSIPNSLQQHRSLFLLPKPKEMNVTLTPNIIELDSDSDDEPRVVVQQNNSTNGGNIDISSKVVPVALTWENNDDDMMMMEEQPLREVHATVEKVSFNEIMLPYTQELDKLLSDTKEQMYNLFDLNNTIEDIEMQAQQKMKHFYSNMRDVVTQLVHINDRVVRQYSEWKRSQKMETETSSSVNENTLVSQETIPLDMICVNDSDTESEYEDQVRKPSDLIKDNNIIKDLLSRKTNVVHRAVGDNSVQLSADKAVQVYDTVLIDFEKYIGYSVFTKTDQNSKTDDSTSNLSVSDKTFSKYEEQFLFYLQQLEDKDKTLQLEDKDKKLSIKEKKDTKMTNSDDMSLQEVMQTNSSFISHLFQDIDSHVTSTDQLENCQENNLSDSINLITKDNKNDTLNKNNKEIVNNSEIETSIQLDKLQETRSQKTHADKETVISDDNEVNSNKNDNMINMEVIAFSGSEEDCTIIDD